MASFCILNSEKVEISKTSIFDFYARFIIYFLNIFLYAIGIKTINIAILVAINISSLLEIIYITSNTIDTIKHARHI